ncbi:pentapeptide repeat-containing protein [Krasilnikovia sp. M28-CT-15]|uniref:pentapeptide repeat-containing protein n=1 Tax=Krasilnikovia sp. M28-CT-15 TaxID=3373540 RepID=UPI00399D56E2
MDFAKLWRVDRRTRRPAVSHDKPLQVMRWLPVTVAAVLVVLLGSALSMWLLGVWAPIPGRVSNPDQLRLDRIKTGLTVAAGLAAGVTLLMTLRRQTWSERAQRFAESDALEQRTTALYVAAATQLGSDKAAVRLAGLYALERLGQDNPKLRQTVVDVWCAYLRMPYTPPAEFVLRNAEHYANPPPAEAEPPELPAESERRQELQVRLAAQRLLATHLRAPAAPASSNTYWLDAMSNRMVIDLVGAVLVDFTLEACDVGRADFSRAEFPSDVSLRGTHFHGYVQLSGARFHGNANLTRAEFHNEADLSWTVFHSDINLGGAVFHTDANLTGSQSHGYAMLSEARFRGNANLNGMQFHGYANLRATRFNARADLSSAHFYGYADLQHAEFHGGGDLSRAQFHGDADLSGTQFHAVVDMWAALFHGSANLAEAHFGPYARLADAKATRRASLPQGWILLPMGPDGDELRLVARDSRQSPQIDDAEPSG